MMGLPWFLWVAFALVFLLAGYCTADLVEWTKARLAKSRWKVSSEDFTMWSIITLGSILGLAILPKVMMQYCEPGLTCELLP